MKEITDRRKEENYPGFFDLRSSAIAVTQLRSIYGYTNWQIALGDIPALSPLPMLQPKHAYQLSHLANYNGDKEGAKEWQEIAKLSAFQQLASLDLTTMNALEKQQLQGIFHSALNKLMSDHFASGYEASVMEHLETLSWFASNRLYVAPDVVQPSEDQPEWNDPFLRKMSELCRGVKVSVP